MPPVGKSGKISIGSFLRILICASRSSGRLWGRMRVAIPTAMPSVPSMSSTGSLAGSATGSSFRPS
jgi:hypothetical protein